MFTSGFNRAIKIVASETSEYEITCSMKFRTIATWMTLISAGTLCLAVGAVRFPPKSRTASSRPVVRQVTEPVDSSVIPMQVASPVGATTTPWNRPGQDARPSQRIDDFPDTRQATAGSMFSSVADSSVADRAPIRRQQANGYQEPEAWPFHGRSTGAVSQSVSHDAGSAQKNSQIDDWPHQPPVSQTNNSGAYQVEDFRHVAGSPLTHPIERVSTDQFPSGKYAGGFNTESNSAPAWQQGVAQQPHTASNDLLNPSLSFGTNAKIHSDASGFNQAQSTYQSLKSPLANIPSEQQPMSPFANPSDAPAMQPAPNGTTASVQEGNDRTTSGSSSEPPPAYTPNSSLPPSAQRQASLKNLPAPQLPHQQASAVEETGYAGTKQPVIQAYAESVTPRDYVTVGQWSGPQDRPVQSNQQVSFDSYPDYEDAQRIPAESMLNPYASRANRYPDSAALPRQSGQLVELPGAYAPWWEEVINKPMRLSPSTHAVNVESLILAAIEYSPQVTALRIDPIVRETQILEEAAEFDWQSFIETRYDDINDPIGNTLTTGDNSSRFTDHNVNGRLGVEKRMAQGGQLDVSQKFGYQDNNSTFFTPTQQGTSRLELNFTQPLLKGAGHTYNESRTVLAMLDHRISEDELQDSLQDHLVDVYTTYWNLYRSRAVRLQKERLLRRAIEVEQKLAARQGIDAVRRQVLRARAAIASRRSEIARADMEVRNAESRLRLLVNSPELKQSTVVELLPDESPMSKYLTVSMRGSVETALQNRPDIRRAIGLMKETAVRLEVSKNELLPKLDFVVGTYFAGLRGQGEVDTAWVDQFRNGRPGYSVGLMLQYPLGNRAAKARYARREWEVARTLKEFEASVESSMSEVELAVREFETSYQEMLSRFQSMIAADTEANYLLERWRLLPGNDQTTSFLLEDLLDAQERVAMEEQDFVEAQVAYVLSIVQLKRASGILLSCDCDNSPVSFMTPASHGKAEPEPLPAPQSSRPVLPEPGHAKSTQPLPILPAAKEPAAKQRSAPVKPSSPDASAPDGAAIIPLPAPAR